jgi:hypothetical protein
MPDTVGRWQRDRPSRREFPTRVTLTERSIRVTGADTRTAIFKVVNV